MQPEKNILIILFILMCPLLLMSQVNPSFEQVLSLKSVSSPEISPDGKKVLFVKQSTDWENNRYDREIWLVNQDGDSYQLTNNAEHSSSSPAWSPDGKWIAFLTTNSDQAQINIMRSMGGATFQFSKAKNGVQSYKWSPDGTKIAFTQREDKKKASEKRKDKFGGFSVEDDEYAFSQLWVKTFDPMQLGASPLPQQLEDSTFKALIEPKLLLDSANFTINRFSWSPDGSMMAIEHQPDPLINSFFNADISIYNIQDSILNPLVSNPSYDGLLGWSPNGASILYQSSLENRTSNYYENGKIFRVNINGSNNKRLAENFDEDIYNVQWTLSGIYALAYQKTKRHLLKINQNSGIVEVLSSSPARIWDYSCSANGQSIAFTGVGDTNLTEVYVSNTSNFQPVLKTQSSRQLQDWLTAQSEVVQWESKDGATIEGILHKPQDYDPTKKYPLMVIIHGGPTGISTPGAAPSYVYPMLQWLNKGALILRPNYRGSAGYGEAFRALNVRNLGVGDAWDVLSGVEYLETEGLIDPEKVASMGWSQGGYISAFLTTNSDKFKAISVGAGISNWMTYYVNTDIHPFTRQYLKGTPWSDKEIYEKTSPMTNINDAVTPTLVQHGEFDRRVPIANAYELYQGLQDVGVPTELVVYKGFGHGISKPKERLAATWHNWIWFARYIWGEEVELPE